MSRRRRRSRSPFRRRSRRRPGWVATLLAVGGLVFAYDRLGPTRTVSRDFDRYDRQQTRVVHVIDGDTIHIDIADHDGKPTRVRLIGVDAPELRTDAGRPAHFAVEAANYVKARVEGKPVTIRLDDRETRDRYGRLLAYVWIGPNDMLNLALVRDGQAYSYRIRSNLFSTQFDMLENQARSARRGLWNDVEIEDMPQWRQEWLADRGIRTP